ncbi:MAG: hypothetical protein ACE5EA_04935 [Nitrospirota bacterium]
MCDTTGTHSHVHGVRSDAEKAIGDLRDNLADKLRSVTRYEAQICLIKEGDFPQSGEIVHLLEHIVEDEKRHVADLMNSVTRLDKVQSDMLHNHSEHHH